MNNHVLKSLVFVIPFAFFFLSFVSLKTETLEEKVEKLKKERKLVAFHPENDKVKNRRYSNKGIIDLGKTLFHDKVLSRNNNVSCASCHENTKGFSNGERFGTGTHGNKTVRNVPHLYNLDMNMSFFWDGRATSLDEQLGMVITSKDELDMDFTEIVTRLKANETYKLKFDSLFPGDGVTKKTFSQAVIAYEKSIQSYGSLYDKYLDGDTSVFNEKQKKGFELFITKANCITCHKGVNLTDAVFHNVGVKTDDIGRSKIDKIGMSNEFNSTPYPFFSTFKAFKTPSLRNVKNSAPYFHDGSKKTLRDVVEMYNKGGENPDQTGLAKEIRPLGLNEQELEALVEFLGTFSSPNEY